MGEEEAQTDDRAYATDFEERYLANANAQMSEQVHSFLHVPQTDVFVEQVPRTFRTETPSVPVSINFIEDKRIIKFFFKTTIE